MFETPAQHTLPDGHQRHVFGLFRHARSRHSSNTAPIFVKQRLPCVYKQNLREWWVSGSIPWRKSLRPLYSSIIVFCNGVQNGSGVGLCAIPPDADIFEINTPDPFPCNDRSPATSRGLNFSAYPYPPADPALARQTKTAVCVLAKSSGESNARSGGCLRVFSGR